MIWVEVRSCRVDNVIIGEGGHDYVSVRASYGDNTVTE
jgi:hypothetical protein